MPTQVQVSKVLLISGSPKTIILNRQWKRVFLDAPARIADQYEEAQAVESFLVKELMNPFQGLHWKSFQAPENAGEKGGDACTAYSNKNA